MATSWLSGLAAALRATDVPSLVAGLAPVLGAGASVTSWTPTADGWTHESGTPIDLPQEVPPSPGVAHDGRALLIRASDDRTERRLLAITAPALDEETAESVAQLVHVAVERITERRSAHAARQRLSDNERIGSLGSYDWHVPTDTNHWSDELFRIYGESPQSFNASYERFLAYIHPDDRDRVQEIHQQAFATGEPYEMEERIVLRDGTERLLWSNGEVVMGADGTPERFIGICRDVTEQRAAERAAAETDQLRLRAHDNELRRRAALELNDAVVQGLTAALWAAETDAPEVARSLLDETMASARRMMDDLLVGPEGLAPGPGELRRTTPPPGHLDRGGDAVAPADDGAAGPDTLRVVIADDAPDVRLLLGIQLARLGVDVVGEATNGREAVALVATHSPDVVLLDLSMPEMDGLEATAAIRRSHPDIRIIVISGYAADTMAPEAEAAGADAYLEKGMRLQERLAPLLGVSV